MAALALAAAVSLQPLSAGAVTDEERAGARAAATEGAKAFEERRWSAVVDMFSRAESLVHSPVHLLYIARAQAKLGQLVQAREYYLKVTRETVQPDSPAAFLKAQQDAQKELAALEPRLAYVTVSVQGRNPNEVTVKMDGKVVPPALVGVPRPVNPGEHGFQAWAKGEESSVSKVTVKEGGRETVVLTLEAVQPGAAPPPAQPGEQPPAQPGEQPPAQPGAGQPGPGEPAPPPGDTGVSLDTADPDTDWMFIGSLASFGVGAVGLGMGIGFAVQKSGNESDADDLFAEGQSYGCPGASGYDCVGAQAAIKKLEDDAASAGTMSAVGFVVGGVGIAAGVTLLVLSMQDDGGESPPAQATITPYVGPGSLGVVGTF